MSGPPPSSLLRSVSCLIPLQGIICPGRSYLCRAWYALHLTYLRLSFAYLPIAGLAEWFSPVEPGTGLHPRPGSAESLKQYFPEINTEWSSVWYASRKGEDVEEIHNRIDGFLEAFALEVERKFPGTHSRVLFVSHAATIIALARSLLGDRESPIRVGCCSISEFDPIPDSQGMVGGWKAKRLADGSHLKDGASRDWGFEDIEIEHGKVVNDLGVPGSELLEEQPEPVGSQIALLSNL
ncbi:hypothetical protein C0991_000145 [Blastosporella zonata]|nr:hypothetical protein C0991_000145 [Blastosporella zonata]